MLLLFFSVLTLLFFQSESYGTESSGYVPVRPDAHLFWWLMRAGNETHDYKQFPLVIWLEGGPGSSSTGFSNFAMIGPLDQDLNPRNQTWLNQANLMFIDNPVGTGYSYVTSDDAFARNNSIIAQDLVTWMKSFLTEYPDFQSIPISIFGESYGGKMAVTFARELAEAIQRQEITAHLHAVGLADASISPVTAIKFFAPYLHANAMIDLKQKHEIDQMVSRVIQSMEGKETSEEAAGLWITLREMVEEFTFGVNWDNVMQPAEPYAHLKRKIREDNTTSHLPIYEDKEHDRGMKSDLKDVMNGSVKQKHGIPQNVTWGATKSKVFKHLMGDFMFDVVHDVEYLLNHTSVKVAAYNGQLDLVGNAISAEAWINELRWDKIDEFRDSRRMLFAGAVGQPKAYVKECDKLSLYWVMNAGHLVALDQPGIMLEIFTNVLRT